MKRFPYEYEAVIPLVRSAIKSREADLVIKEEKELEKGRWVFFSRTTYMKMDLDPGAVVRVIVEKGKGKDKNTYIRVYSLNLTKSGLPSLKKASDYAEIIAMKVDAVLKSSEMQKRYKDLQ